MRNNQYPDRERVRIDFSKTALDAAADMAHNKGVSLSGFIEELVLEKTGLLPNLTTREYR